MTQDEVLFQKHLSDLAGTADRRGFAVFTDFMNLNELNIFHASAQKFSYVTTKTFGVYEHAERQMAAFIPDALLFQWSFPIACLRIRPLNKKLQKN